jgi:phytanoyl-CoA hydroxylase
MALSSEQVEAYRRDGFVVAKELYAPDTMLRWKQIMSELIAAEPKNTSGVRVWMADTIHPVLREGMKDDRVTPILRQIIGPDVEFLSAKAVFKNAATAFASPWHQDWFYWEGATKISVWIALDDATVANGCLKFVPGSHKKVFAKRTVRESVGFDHRITDDDLSDWPQVTVEARRGDAVFFHDLAVHSSHPNTAGTDRWSLISTYRDAGTRDGSKVWKKPLLVAGQSVNGAA